ncbi:hypothetical protein QL285_020987 [Trifolium repens]|nr:hypothetical protein QL285_020987 [Trifolium repens]
MPPPKTLHADVICDVMQIIRTPLEPIHGAFHFGSSLSLFMSRVQQNGSKDPASLVDAGLPLRVDHHCQASDPIVVDSCVPPQVQQPADDFLTAIQTYHLEFDVENFLGRLPACFVREFGKAVSDYVILRDPNHNEFEVHVVRKSGEIYFGDGWHTLKDVYDIKFGAWVSVCYISPVLFTMRVLSRWCFEVSYPYYDPPLKHLLARSDPHSSIGSSVMNFCAAGGTRQKSLITSYVKDLTLYDIHSGILVLPWQGFGESAFAFVFSDLILVDNGGKQYKCGVKFGLDIGGELACRIAGGWRDLCAFHGLVEADRVKFSVTQFSASNVMYVSLYPRVRVEDYLNMDAVDD